MEIIQIKSADDEYIHSLMPLYQEAFPENQRHTEEDFKALLGSEPDFYCNAVLMNDNFVGFFNYWDFDWFIYAEHFAILEAIRGNKLGEKVMNMMKPQSDIPMVFEVELPDEEMAARRIEFYRRLGYEVVPVDYQQPPYNRNGYYQPLFLMTDQVDFVIENFEKIKSTIYRRVYKVEL